MTIEGFENIAIADIPWQRLTTPYGRGSELPRLIVDGQYGEIAGLIEHQSTLWQVTPWVLLLLLRGLKTKHPEEVSPAELHVYHSVADALIGSDLKSIPHMPQPRLLLDESYLWPVDEEEDEVMWEEEEPPGYDELPFSSYYYYSGLLLKDAIPDFERLKAGNPQISAEVSELLEKLKPDGTEGAEGAEGAE